MSGLGAPAVAQRPTGPIVDPVTACLDAVSVGGGRLFLATMSPHERDRLIEVLAEARDALASAEARGTELRAALAPASDVEIEGELRRLIRSWPQDKRGDLAGYGAELTVFVLERRPSRRALQQACRELKLGRVHLPSIAEVISTLDAVEGRLTSAAQQLAALPERIARGEAMLGRSRPAPAAGGAA